MVGVETTSNRSLERNPKNRYISTHLVTDCPVLFTLFASQSVTVTETMLTRSALVDALTPRAPNIERAGRRCEPWLASSGDLWRYAGGTQRRRGGQRVD